MRTECLPLNGLETLDDETARALARHAGGPLVLNALALAAPTQGAKAGVPDAAASGSKMGKHGQQEVHEPLVSPETVMEVLLAGLSSHGQTR
jgi:hypothetical protein